MGWIIGMYILGWKVTPEHIALVLPTWFTWFAYIVGSPLFALFGLAESAEKDSSLVFFLKIPLYLIIGIFMIHLMIRAFCGLVLINEIY